MATACDMCVEQSQGDGYVVLHWLAEIGMVRCSCGGHQCRETYEKEEK